MARYSINLDPITKLPRSTVGDDIAGMFDRIGAQRRADEEKRLAREAEAAKLKSLDQYRKDQIAAQNANAKVQGDAAKRLADKDAAEQRRRQAEAVGGLTSLLGEGKKTEAQARAQAEGYELTPVQKQAIEQALPETPELAAPSMELGRKSAPRLEGDRELTAPTAAASPDAQVRKLSPLEETLSEAARVSREPEKYRLKMGEQEMVIDPTEARTGQIEQREADAARFEETTAPRIAEMLPGEAGAKIAKLAAGMLRDGATRGQVDQVVAQLVSQERGGLDTERSQLDRASREKNARIAAAGASQGRLSIEDERTRRAENDRRERTIYDPDTGTEIGLAASPTIAKAAGTRIEALSKMRSLGSQLEADFAKPVDGLDAVRRRQQLMGDLQLAFKTAEELGAIQGADLGFISNVLGNQLETVTGYGGVERMKRLAKSIDDARARVINSSGAGSRPGTPAAPPAPRAAPPLADPDLDGEVDDFLGGTP